MSSGLMGHCLTITLTHKPYNKKHCKIYVLKLWGFWDLGFWDLGYDIGLKVNYLSKLWRNSIAKDVMQLNQLKNSTE